MLLLWTSVNNSTSANTPSNSSFHSYSRISLSGRECTETVVFPLARNIRSPESMFVPCSIVPTTFAPARALFESAASRRIWGNIGWGPALRGFARNLGHGRALFIAEHPALAPQTKAYALRAAQFDVPWRRILSELSCGTLTLNCAAVEMLASVMSGRGPSFQPMAIPNRAFTAVTGHFEILRQFQTVRGTSVFAQAAEHAARSIVSESGKNLAPRRIVTQPAHDDQIFRTSQRTQIARNAQRLPSLRIHVQPRRPAIALGHHRPFLRILLGVNIFRRLIAKRDPHALEKVH